MSAASKAFKITRGRGLQVTFENGYTVSVQFGPGNYCDHYNSDGSPIECGAAGSNTAELAIIAPDGDFVHQEEWGGEVSSRSTPAEMLSAMVRASKMEGRA